MSYTFLLTSLWLENSFIVIQLQWMIGIEILHLGWFCLDKAGGKNLEATSHFCLTNYSKF